MSEQEAFAVKLKEDYKRVFKLFIWIVVALFTSLVGLGAKQLTADAVKAEKIYQNEIAIKDIEGVIVPNYDLGQIILLMDLKTDAILKVTDSNREDIKIIMDQFNKAISSVLYPNLPATRSVNSE